MLFKKSRCGRCGNKIDKKFNFCPWCGNGLKSRENFLMPEPDFGFPFNMILNSMKPVIKGLEKQMREMDSKKANDNVFEIRVNVGANENGQPIINIGGNEEIGNMIEPVKEAKIKTHRISKKEAEKFAQLPKIEPITHVRRLANKIIYEIEMPGVKDKKSIIITKLQDGIEIKAFSKDKVYLKLIPISLPILKYVLEKERLVIELKPEM
jgi:hypothetical protein